MTRRRHGPADRYLRKAAEIAILAGHENCLRILLPEVPLYWLPELISIVGSRGRFDMVDMVIGQVEGLQKLRSLAYYGISPDGSERYFRERLLADGIRGAASHRKPAARKPITFGNTTRSC